MSLSPQKYREFSSTHVTHDCARCTPDLLSGGGAVIRGREYQEDQYGPLVVMMQVHYTPPQVERLEPKKMMGLNNFGISKIPGTFFFSGSMLNFRGVNDESL